MVPIATTSVSVSRPTEEEINGEPTFGGPTPVTLTVVASGVRATIGQPTGYGNRGGTEQSVVTYTLQCDPFDGEITRLDEVVDEISGVKYRVQWAILRTGLGIDHWSAELVRTDGV